MGKYVITIRSYYFVIVFALQTGSGKTFAITGSPDNYEERGIIPRSIQHIFDYTINVRIAYMVRTETNYCHLCYYYN